jgi:hypothetical protein
MIRSAAIGALALFALAGAAQAQLSARAQLADQPPPTVVRGKVTALSDNLLTVQPDTGAAQKVTLAPAWNVAVMKPVAIDAIQPGSFIGTANMPRGEGQGTSLEVHVFPPGVKMGEGHYGWDLKPGSMMTNGTVGKVVAGKKGSRELDVTYNGSNQRHITVPANVPVVQITGGSREQVKVGTPVFVVARKVPDGTLAASSVSIGENGAKPPM